MSADWLRRPYCALAILAVGLTGAARAGVSTDGTAGPRIRLNGPDYAIGADLGTRAGPNLFHSFEKFSLANGQRATFSGPNGVRNVISRVTGGARSDIDGTLRSTIPEADFYFINPAGVMFGPNARLDLQGSFHVSTADELRFADGTRFGATDPTASSFTVAPPESFGFLGADPTPILVNRSILAVPAGEALSLIGGDVAVLNADGPIEAQALLQAEAGTVGLLAIGGPGAASPGAGIVGGAGTGIVLVDRSVVDASGNGGGAILIQGGLVLVGRGSRVLAANTGAADAAGGITVAAEGFLVEGGSALVLDASGSGAGGRLAVDGQVITIVGGSQLRAVASGDGNAGSVALRAGTVRLEDGGLVIASTIGPGRGGDVTVMADELRIVRHDPSQPTGLLVQANSGATGDAGAIAIRAGTVALADGGVIGVDTRGAGRAGTVSLQASRLHIDGGEAAVSTRISSDAFEGSTGDGGSVTIDAGRVLIERGGTIGAEADGAGHGGVISIDAGRLVIRSGEDRFTGLSGLAQGDAGGDAGIISVHADRVEVRSGGLIASSTAGPGDAGTIDIDAGRVRVDGEGVPSTGISSIAFPASGNGGVIRVQAGDVRVLNGGVINTTTFGDGAGGRIRVKSGRLTIARQGGPFTGVSSSVETGATGAGGAVRVIAGDVTLRDGGQIRSLTFGAGAAGRVHIRADRLMVTDNVPAGLASRIEPGSLPFGITRSAILISAEPTLDGAGLILPRGGGGALRIEAGEIALADGAVISSSSFSPDQPAGNVLITADRLELRAAAILTGARFAGGGRITLVIGRIVDLADSSISSAVGGGQTTTAGDITIDPEFLILDRSSILARANEGQGGNIEITVDNLIQSPGSVISASAGPAGIDGTVVISTPEVDLSGGLVVLSGAIVDTAPLRARCGARRDIGASSFTGVGRPGLPPTPDGPLASGFLGADAAPAAGAALPAAALLQPCAPRS